MDGTEKEEQPQMTQKAQIFAVENWN